MALNVYKRVSLEDIYNEYVKKTIARHPSISFTNTFRHAFKLKKKQLKINNYSDFGIDCEQMDKLIEHCLKYKNTTEIDRAEIFTEIQKEFFEDDTTDEILSPGTHTKKDGFDFDNMLFNMIANSKKNNPLLYQRIMRSMGIDKERSNLEKQIDMLKEVNNILQKELDKKNNTIKQLADIINVAA